MLHDAQAFQITQYGSGVCRWFSHFLDERSRPAPERRDASRPYRGLLYVLGLLGVVDAPGARPAVPHTSRRL